MKSLKLVLVSLLAAAGVAKSATVTLSSGFGTGIIVTADSVNTAYSVTIGGYEGGVFTQFGTVSNAFASGVKLGGAYGGTGPDSLNGDRVFIRIAINTTNGSGFGIFQTSTQGTATGLFAADVTSALASTTANVASTSFISLAAVGGVVQSSSFGSANNLNLVTVPEPSVALLGALGLFGLVRRRR
jgi:hypothetical protein